ncbi:hypothetical protein Dsin_004984 [Dipteronia sinensis]|uniref:Uncharacterized protein n=1 Tax=Dipteronia sinensis TaxID=43782 RepID=A0AAE0AW12_9ROSI|nr:hypothetical protein Dsin_004984 [Dipteronia sinensis]
MRACKRPFIDFCSHYYKKSSLVEAYARVIRPVGHMSDWEIPNEISSLVVHPLERMSQAGRPCKVRKKIKRRVSFKEGKNMFPLQTSRPQSTKLSKPLRAPNRRQHL